MRKALYILPTIIFGGAGAWWAFAVPDEKPEPVITGLVVRPAPPDHIAHALGIERYTGSMVVNRPFTRLSLFADIYRDGERVERLLFTRTGDASEQDRTFQGMKLTFAFHVMDLDYLPLGGRVRSDTRATRELPPEELTRIYGVVSYHNEYGTGSHWNRVDVAKSQFDAGRAYGRSSLSQNQVPRETGADVPLFVLVAGEQGPVPVLSSARIEEYVAGAFGAGMPGDRSLLVAYLKFE